MFQAFQYNSEQMDETIPCHQGALICAGGSIKTLQIQCAVCQKVVSGMKKNNARRGNI